MTDRGRGAGAGRPARPLGLRAAARGSVYRWRRGCGRSAPYLYAGILVFATIGAYNKSQSALDIVILYAIGVVGFFMRKYDFPAAPVIIGMILGPYAEQAMRQALVISQGDWTAFVTRPISATLLAIAVLALFGPRLWAMARSR
jgi:putative tricarboxylic transport membrane protein